MPGLDPGIHLLRKKLLRRSMDCRVKPGNDCGWGSAGMTSERVGMTSRGGAPIAFEDPDRLADAIIERVGKTIVLALPFGRAKATPAANALFDGAAADPSINLRIFTALTLEKPRSKSGLERRFLEPVVDRVFAGYPELAYALALHAGTLPPNI